MKTRRILPGWWWVLGWALTAAVWAQVPPPGSEGQIPLTWAPDFDAALRLAEKEKKAVVLDVTTDWCGWSKKMDRETFAAPAVQKLLRGCVMVRLNSEASDRNREIAEQYGVDSYPTLIVVNYRGEAVAWKEGYLEAEKCAKFLKGALAGFEKLGPLGYAAANLGPDDLLRKALERMPKPDELPTSAGAVVLLDYCDLTVAADASTREIIRQTVYVIDPDRGPVQAVVRQYNSSREKLRLRSVQILNRQGQGRQVDVALAEDEHEYSDQNVYWDVRRLALELPPLRAGQILDVVEERESQPVMPGHFAWRWRTSGATIVLGDLTVHFPQTLGLMKEAVRCPTPMTETKGADGSVTWRLVTHHPPPPDPEFYSPAANEDWEGYVIGTPTTWNAVAAWFRGLCAGRDALPPDAQARVAELKRRHREPAKLLQAILDWVTKDIRYVSVSFGQSSHQPHPVAETLANGYGDCKDQALVLQALCREAGIPSALVLLGAGYGRVFDGTNAAIQQLDHCLLEAQTGGRTYHLDPSAGRAPIDWLPVYDAAAQALRVGEKSSQVITLPPYQAREDSTNRKTVKLNPNGSATITEIRELRGPAAYAAKLRMRQINLEKMRKQLEDSMKKAGQKLLAFSVTDPKGDDDDTYRFKISYTLPRFASRSADGLVFKLWDGSEEGRDWTAALEAARARPFRFYPTDASVEIVEVELPDGAVVKSKPDDIQLETGFLRASRQVSVVGNKITLTEKSRLLDARLPASDAAKVHSAFRKIQDHREHAVLVALLPADPAPAAADSPGR